MAIVYTIDCVIGIPDVDEIFETDRCYWYVPNTVDC